MYTCTCTSEIGFSIHVQMNICRYPFIEIVWIYFVLDWVKFIRMFKVAAKLVHITNGGVRVARGAVGTYTRYAYFSLTDRKGRQSSDGSLKNIKRYEPKYDLEYDTPEDYLLSQVCNILYHRELSELNFKKNWTSCLMVHSFYALVSLPLKKGGIFVCTCQSFGRPARCGPFNIL